MAESVVRQICADARFYRQLKHPGKTPSTLGTLFTALSSPGLWLLASHRVAFYSTFNRNVRNPLWWLARVVETIGAYISAIATKSEILGDCDMQGPVYLSDQGYFMFGALKVGGGTVIHKRVTLGIAVTSGKPERPTIGANVWIGNDCVIAGNLHVGDGATIMPGTYLTYSVPPGAVVKGNPARVMRPDFDNSKLRSSLTIFTELPAIESKP